VRPIGRRGIFNATVRRRPVGTLDNVFWGTRKDTINKAKKSTAKIPTKMFERFIG
jgi:hypothetical protein